MKRTLRKLSQYGLFHSDEENVPLPFEAKKKEIKDNLLKNAEKLAEKLRQRKIDVNS
jgi:hypothetical protein